MWLILEPTLSNYLAKVCPYQTLVVYQNYSIDKFQHIDYRASPISKAPSLDRGRNEDRPDKILAALRPVATIIYRAMTVTWPVCGMQAF